MDEAKHYSEAEAARFLDRGGLWQWRQLILILLSFLSSGMQSFSIIFIGFQPKFTCRDNLEETRQWNLTNDDKDIFNDLCTKEDNSTGNTSFQCQTGFLYSVKREESIVSEWDLICDKAYLSEVSQLLYIVGMGVGALIAGPVSDRLGRKKTYLIARVLSLCCSTGLVFSPGIEVFMVLRFLTGSLEVSSGLVRATYLTELTPVKFRGLTTTLAGIFWALPLCLEALIGHVLRGWNWRIFQAIITTFTLTVILEIVYVKESLNWLFANQKSKEATDILKEAFKTNGITAADLCSSSELIQPLTKEITHKYAECQKAQSKDQIYIESMAESHQETKITLIDIMKNRTMRRRILMTCFVWFVNSLVYYGLFLMSPAMVGDRVLNFFIIAVVEIPACLGLFGLLRVFGRKKTLIGCHALCAICLLLAGVFNFTIDGDMKDISMLVVTSIGKVGIAASYTLLYFFTTDTLPTNFRTSGLGLASFSARCGSCIASFSSVLLRVLPWGPGVIFGSLSLVVSGLLFLVPETDHQKLPKTISEIESWRDATK